MNHNRRANREVMRVITTFVICLLFTLVHVHYMNTMLYNARLSNEHNFQEFMKELGKKEVIIKEQQDQMKGMVKKPVVKKKILPHDTCK